MKKVKVAISAFALLSLFTGVQAQTLAPKGITQPFHFGLKAGYNASSLSTLSYANNLMGARYPFSAASNQPLQFDFVHATSSGFHVGLFFSKGLLPNLALQVELLYSQQGGRMQNALSSANLGGMPINRGEDFENLRYLLQEGAQNPNFGMLRKAGINQEGYPDLSITQSYINIPILFTYSLPMLPALSIHAGPYIGFVVNTQVSSGGKDILPADLLFMKKEIFSESVVDIGASFGLGYAFAKRFELGLRYNLGFTGIYNKDDDDDNAMTSNAKNSIFQVSLAYKLY